MKRIGLIQPDAMSAPIPAFAMVGAPVAPRARAAPPTPPIRAGDVEGGRPSPQVTRLQAIPPIEAAGIRLESTAAGSTSALPRVLATPVLNATAAMKLKKAAQRT